MRFVIEYAKSRYNFAIILINIKRMTTKVIGFQRSPKISGSLK